jgi:excisionase family DNA binding protein
MTTIYTAHIELRETVTPARAIALHDRLADYHASVGTSPRGWLSFQISLPAESLSQAITTALAVIAAAVPGVEALHADVMTEAEFDALNGFVPVPELLSTQEAADELGVTRQRIGQMVREGKFPTATQVGGTTVIAKSDVDAKK